MSNFVSGATCTQLCALFEAARGEEARRTEVSEGSYEISESGCVTIHKHFFEIRNPHPRCLQVY